MTSQLTVRPDGVAIIELDNPPFNTHVLSLCESLFKHTTEAVADPEVKAIILTGKGNLFCGGAELSTIHRYRKPGQPSDYPVPELAHGIINALDGSSKVTVAALNGHALGGGFELALGCHYRIGSPNAKIGSPEVTFGILPSFHGTQRVTRLTDMKTACKILLTGSLLNAEEALKAEILDDICRSGDIIEYAVNFSLNNKTRPISKLPCSTLDRNGLGEEKGTGLTDIIDELPLTGSVAERVIVKCIMAAITLDDFKAGLELEMDEGFKLITDSLEHKALLHLYFADRGIKIKKIKGLTAKPSKIQKVGIIGSGSMGNGIAMCFMEKNIPVVLKDTRQECLDEGVSTIKQHYETSDSKKNLEPSKMEKLMGLLHPTLSYDDLKDVDLIIDTVPEIMDLKKQVFAELGKVVGPNVPVCTNTSGFDFDIIAETIPHPSRVMGVHFSPANGMQLLEIARTTKTSHVTIATCMSLSELLNKKVVLVENCDGLVGDRMLGPYIAEARQMIEEGATIEQIETVAEKDEFGMALGPHAWCDLVGLDLSYNMRKNAGTMQLDTKASIGPYEVTDWLVEQGRYGVKTGRGIFLYDAKTSKRLGVDPEVLEQIKKVQKSKGITPRKFESEEIIERLMFPLVNEGFKILEEGYAQKPSDIDIIYTTGYGFPREKGGPMFWADNYVGLDIVLDRLRVYGEDARKRYTSNKNYRKIDYFEPSKLLEECVAAGKTLSEVWGAKST